MASAATNLLSLPTELLEHVANLAIEDAHSELFPLRLTCKDVSEKLWSLFSKLFFQDIRIVISDKQSVGVLRKISEHPILAPRVKCIRFALFRIREWKADHPYIVDRMEDVLASREELGQEAYDAKHRMHRDLFDAQEQYRESGLLPDLKSTWENFKDQNRFPQVILSHWNDQCESPKARDDVLRAQLRYDALGWWEYNANQDYYAYALMSFNSALFFPRHLTLGAIQDGLQLSTLADWRWFLCKNLVELNITIQPETQPPFDYDEDLTPHASAIMTAHNLEVLRIRTATQLEYAPAAFHDSLMETLRNATNGFKYKDYKGALRKLRVLKLDGIQVDQNIMESFVYEFAGHSLRRISIKNVPNWQEELDGMASAFLRSMSRRIDYAKDVEVHVSSEWDRLDRWIREGIPEDMT